MLVVPIWCFWARGADSRSKMLLTNNADATWSSPIGDCLRIAFLREERVRAGSSTLSVKNWLRRASQPSSVSFDHWAGGTVSTWELGTFARQESIQKARADWWNVAAWSLTLKDWAGVLNSFILRAKSRNIKTDYAQYNERSSNFWSCRKEWLLQCRRAKKIGLGCLACQEYRLARHDEVLLIVEVLAFRLTVALVRGNLVFDFVLSPESWGPKFRCSFDFQLYARSPWAAKAGKIPLLLPRWTFCKTFVSCWTRRKAGGFKSQMAKLLFGMSMD